MTAAENVFWDSATVFGTVPAFLLFWLRVVCSDIVTLSYLHYSATIFCVRVQSYAKQLSTDNNWPEPRPGSAVVWREVMAFGGRRLLIGDGNDFEEMVSAYYGVTSGLSSCQVVQITDEDHRNKLQVCSC